MPRRSSATRKPARRTAKRGLGARLAVHAGTWALKQQKKRTATVRARKDAVLRRTAHAGCKRCGGAGIIPVRGKNGEWRGSRSCPAKPPPAAVSRARIATAARFGQDKASGLCGWRCPCHKGEKPRYRTAKEATAALKRHEKRRHGGESVGGYWYLQIPATTTGKPVHEAARPRAIRAR